MTDLSEASHLREVNLDDKYVAEQGRVYLTGTQALVRLPLMQKRRDRAAGMNTAGYITGYRGSPLGAFDDQLHKAKKHLQAHDTVFVPGINEDLAATAVWGSQQAETAGEGKFDGVYAIWYGKGPGVDRSGDAFRHGNLAGASRHGGVLVLMGDDHTCESSTTCHQSEFALVDAQMPILSPSGVQELIDYGLLGWALSRYSGCWVGMKCVKDTVEASGSIDVDDARLAIHQPSDFTPPEGGLSLRQPDTPQAQEFRLVNHKLEAAKAFARANRLDAVVLGQRAGARLGIVTSGKSWLDLRQALADLGIGQAQAEQLGLAVYKVGMVWPLEPAGLREFALGLQQVIVIEEKRSLLESQVKELLYGAAGAPPVIGKKDERGQKLFAVEMALDAAQIGQVVGSRLSQMNEDAALAARVEELRKRKLSLGAIDVMQRSFYFCAGCPHNTSTHVPEGSRAYAGIGCSWMAQVMDRGTTGYTQMGAEGMSWVGEAPFSRRKHMFQNLGDGTYFHSGLLAIRAAVAAGTNITYKILFNDAVAMTGGQRHDGPLDPPRITRQVHAEGVTRIAVVSDEPEKYTGELAWAPAVTIHHRADLDAVQRMLRDVPGTTVLVYDQTCAAEKRRRRKRGAFPDPAMRLLINEAVCEGCGDCGVQSNCVALVPVETELGRKRAIDQSSCNKDYSCVNGFCPSFVTVRGGKLKRGASAAGAAVDTPLANPKLPDLSQGVWSLVITGVGGTGVVTIGAVLGMAAHLEGKGVGVLDMAGLAQKGGSVWTHMRFGAGPTDIAAVRVSAGGADAVLGCDLVVTAGGKTLGMARKGRTRIVLNLQEVMPGHFAREPDMQFPSNPLVATIHKAVGSEAVHAIDAGQLATALCGDAMATNLFMLGAAYQHGLIPVGAVAIEKAIELNGASVQMNLAAFNWGRRFAADPVGVRGAAGMQEQVTPKTPPTVERRAELLAAYQDKRYAERFLGLVYSARAVEARLWPGRKAFSEAVAASMHKLMAYKDEYEVARLYTAPEFRRQLEATFEGDTKLAFNLAPPIISKADLQTGHQRKREFGAWILPAFGVLARLKFLRGTALDPFGGTKERVAERELIARYEQLVRQLLEEARPQDEALALQLAALPMQVRGYGHVKAKAMERFTSELSQLLSLWARRGHEPRVADEESALVQL